MEVLNLALDKLSKAFGIVKLITFKKRKTQMIKKEGSAYVLYNHTGTKVLGRHATREKAVKQEQAIKANESKGKK